LKVKYISQKTGGFFRKKIAKTLHNCRNFIAFPNPIFVISKHRNTMINIRIAPETKPYLPQPTTLAWVKTRISGTEEYRLEMIETASANNMNAGWGKGAEVCAKLSLLESGAVLASFPLLGKMPGTIQPDLFTTWFLLDAPALVPAGIFGWEIEIAAGRHLMASSLGSWVVFFKPVNAESPWNPKTSLMNQNMNF